MGSLREEAKWGEKKKSVCVEEGVVGETVERGDERKWANRTIE